LEGLVTRIGKHDKVGESYDYIIVGAGSAGCVLANRLTEDGSSVLLLEAGKWDRDPLIHIPAAIGKIFPERLHDWGYFMEPDPGIDGRGIECARGKVIGGSSSVNVMVYVRGHKEDYERWARNGATGWSYDDVLPYFKRSESWEDGADDYRGGDGPLHTQRTRYTDPILESFIEGGNRPAIPALKIIMARSRRGSTMCSRPSTAGGAGAQRLLICAQLSSVHR